MKKEKLMKNGDFVRRMAGPTMDVTAYRARNLTLRGATALARALIASRPEAMTVEESGSFATLREGYEAAATVLDRVDAMAVGTLELRNTLLGAYGSVKSMLDTLAASPAEEAAKAAMVRNRSLGAAPSIARMKPREAWMAVESVRRRLALAPELREQLEALVTPGLVAKLLAAQDALGLVIGVTKNRTLPQLVDGRLVLAYLTRCLDHYAVCVAATATPGNEDAVTRAEEALAPIREVRAELSRDRARSGGADDEVTEPDEPDVIAAPDPAPVADDVPLVPLGDDG